MAGPCLSHTLCRKPNFTSFNLSYTYTRGYHESLRRKKGHPLTPQAPEATVTNAICMGLELALPLDTLGPIEVRHQIRGQEIARLLAIHLRAQVLARDLDVLLRDAGDGHGRRGLLDEFIDARGRDRHTGIL